MDLTFKISEVSFSFKNINSHHQFIIENGTNSELTIAGFIAQFNSYINAHIGVQEELTKEDLLAEPENEKQYSITLNPIQYFLLLEHFHSYEYSGLLDKKTKQRINDILKEASDEIVSFYEQDVRFNPPKRGFYRLKRLWWKLFG